MRIATAVDIDAVAVTLGRAFLDDPVMAWLLPDERQRSARLAQFFAALLRRIHIGQGLVYTTDGFAGAAAWDPPGGWSVGLVTQARLAPAMVGIFGGRVVRLLSLLSAMERKHLREPHYYLAQIGTDPAHQGKGVGAALLAPMLARCDAEQVPAYLESSNPRNVTFYQRHGFEITGSVDLRNGPSLTLMRRPPGA